MFTFTNDYAIIKIGSGKTPLPSDSRKGYQGFGKVLV